MGEKGRACAGWVGGSQTKVTYLTLERLLSGVSPHMLQQVALVPSGIAAGAHIALEGRGEQVFLVVSL